MTETYSDGTTHFTSGRFDDFDRLEAVTDACGRSLGYGITHLYGLEK